ncbi:MAG: hypothetical protein N5P05_002205 [Chroococcopsis gigantea SAG 12.99]|jgi:hypothetical protein|nr:hypothetical protein [Chroococcopsis gigantea SAG 12.99]
MIKKSLLAGLTCSTLIFLAFSDKAQAVNMTASYGATVLATGLANPRGVTVDAQGNVYVAESGTGGAGPCIGTRCYGTTGSIGVYNMNTMNYSHVITGLASLAGSSGDDAAGISDLTFDAAGNLYGVIGFGGGPADLNTLGPLGEQFGKVMSFSSPSAPNISTLADISGYQFSNNITNSNPYSLASDGNGGFYVTDAGANNLVKAASDGSVSTLVSFPDDPNTGMQAVPTGVAVGPDNNPYIGQLTGFPFPTGGANVFTVDQTNTLQTFATGFTTITDVSFGPDGSLYVLEYSTDFFTNPQGSIWQIQTDGTKNLIYTDPSLINPTGLFVQDSDTIFVTNKGPSGTDGELLVLSTSIDSLSTPEPSTVVSLATLGLLSAYSLKRRTGKK